MMRSRWHTTSLGLGLLLAALVRPDSLGAQDSTRTIDFGTPADSLGQDEIPPAALAAAIARFNAPTTTRTHGTLVVTAGNVIEGTLGVHRGTLRVAGTVRGDVIVLNGDVRIDEGGAITGSITVLGGRIVLAPGVQHAGARTEYPGVASVGPEPDGTIALRARRRGLTDYTTASATFTTGPVRTTLSAEANAYNRVEGLPILIGPTLVWQPDDLTTLRLRLTGILRTAGDPDGLRNDFGWLGRFELARSDPGPVTLAVDAGSSIVPVFDHAYAPMESGFGAFIFRRDYRDWYNSSGAGVSVAYTPRPAVAIQAGYRWARERTVRAVDAFSVLRADESWRPNPVIDDGRFRILGVGLSWDTRDDEKRPLSGWFARADLRHVTSNELTPVTLPSLVREGMPTSGYASTEFEFDVRRYLRLDPRQSVHLRLTGGGWVAGDPLTVQRRRSMGGKDPLAGYDFRRVTCDRRRRPDPAGTALCDRQLLFQVELRRTFDLGISARIAGASLGLEQADVVLFGDAGTAWIAGDGPAQVPANRIQAIDEWLADIGVGLQGRVFGVFVAKAITDDDSPRVSFRMQRRF